MFRPDNARIVLAHPNPDSFNAALAGAAADALRQRGMSVELSKFYRLDFDPVEGARHFGKSERGFDVQMEQRRAF